MWTIYCYTNKINGKKYIGLTSKIKSVRAGKNGIRYIESGQYFGLAIQKYGWNAFEYSVLATIKNYREASNLEIYYIELFNTQDKRYGYNRNKGGAVGISQEIVQYNEKLEKIHEYKNLKEATDSTGIEGCLISASCNLRIKYAGGYIWRYKEEENKFLEDKYTIPFSGERRVTQFDENMNPIKIYNSAKEAELETGALRSKICMCCKGQRKTAGGYKWQYTDGFNLKDVFNPSPSLVRRIAQYDLLGGFIAEFKSQNDAHRKIGFSASMIGECCRGIRNEACGFIWKYIE